MRDGSEAQGDRDTAEKLVHVRWCASGVSSSARVRVQVGGARGAGSLGTAVRTGHARTHTTNNDNPPSHQPKRSVPTTRLAGSGRGGGGGGEGSERGTRGQDFDSERSPANPWAPTPPHPDPLPSQPIPPFKQIAKRWPHYLRYQLGVATLRTSCSCCSVCWLVEGKGGMLASSHFSSQTHQSSHFWSRERGC